MACQEGWYRLLGQARQVSWHSEMLIQEGCDSVNRCLVWICEHEHDILYRWYRCHYLKISVARNLIETLEVRFAIKKEGFLQFFVPVSSPWWGNWWPPFAWSDLECEDELKISETERICGWHRTNWTCLNTFNITELTGITIENIIFSGCNIFE